MKEQAFEGLAIKALGKVGAYSSNRVEDAKKQVGLASIALDAVRHVPLFSCAAPPLSGLNISKFHQFRQHKSFDTDLEVDESSPS